MPISDATAAPVERQPLWPRDIHIPVLGCAGELHSGKTLFGLTIDPLRTIAYDMEKSSESYLGLGFTRIDVPTELLKKYPDGYSPLQVFEWIRDDIRKIPPGKYTVGMIDPVTDVEAGLVDYVKANPKEFGKTATQYERASALLWGDVKNYWKSILLDFTSRFETFYFTAHMRQVWKGNSPTSRREPQGKDTLAKLATLYLLLDRLPNKKGDVPEKPRGRVLKDRLSHTSIVDGEPVIQPILPPQLPEATPAAIRRYIIVPPNYEKLTAKEKVPEKPLSDDEKLEIQVEISRNEVDAETMRAGRFEQVEQAAKILNENKKSKTAAKTAAKTVDEESASKLTDGKLDAARAQDAPPSAQLTPAELEALKTQEKLEKEKFTNRPIPKAALEDGSLNPELLQMVLDQFKILGMTQSQITKSVQKRGVDKPGDLSPEDAEDLRKRMWDIQWQMEIDAKIAAKKQGN